MKRINLKHIILPSLLVFVVGCGSGSSNRGSGELPEARFEPDSSIPSWTRDVEHEAELTWYINYGWFEVVPWGSDVVTAKMKSDLGVTINFLVGDIDNLNTMLASGDLPDIITVGGYQDITREAHNFAHPLNVLAEKYDPYFLENAVKPETLAWHTMEDGNIYGYPNFSVTARDIELGRVRSNQGFMVREDIYEAIGSPDMSTPDGFLNALRDAVAHTPTADHGVALVGFAGNAMNMATGGNGSFGGTLQDFLAIPVIDAQGNFYDRDADETYLEWLLVFRQALEEGLMNNDQFSDDGALLQERQQLGTYFSFMSPNLNELVHVLSNNIIRSPEQVYIPVHGPKNSSGADHTFSAGEINGWVQTFVTTSARDPQTAMQVITYLTSEHGQIVNAFGVEGETFDWIDGMAVFTPELEEIRNTDFERFDREFGMGKYWFLQDSAFTDSVGSRPPAPLIPMVEMFSRYIVPRFEIEMIDPSGTSLARNLDSVNAARTQAIVAVIQANSDEEGRAIWQDFLDGRATHNWQEIVDYRNEQISYNRERLSR